MTAPLMVLPAHVARRRPRRGHADVPGTGPEPETCGTCQHVTNVDYARTYWKCLLMRARWTHGAASDVKLRDPACRNWEANHV